MIIILSCLIVFLLYGTIEYYIHLQRLHRIPIRILVNGTRGKSSITRLIAAGLNAGGLRTFAKTTGSATRLIHPDGKEETIERRRPATILEQMQVIRRVAKCHPVVLVIECMAIRPHLQMISTEKIIKPLITVISHIGSDHLDTMGPELKDVARAFANTIPRHGHVFTSEKIYFDEFAAMARDRASKIHFVDFRQSDSAALTYLTYYEHSENIALALAICQHFAISGKQALKAMKKAPPDPGALQKYDTTIGNKSITFINAFAANDADSILKIVRQFAELSAEKSQVAFLINLRPDRPHRTKQLLSLLRHHLNGDLFFLSGQPQNYFMRMAVRAGVDKKAFVQIRNSSLESLMTNIEKMGKDQMLLFGIGNIAGLGIEFLKWLTDKDTEQYL